MTPQEAHATLSRLVANPNAPDEIRRAWRALDGALKGDAELPQEWARLTATAAAARAGKRTMQMWADAVNKGYAPPPDGTDDMGRNWWHPSTVDAFRNGEWQRQRAARAADERPPNAGPGAGRDVWFTWARQQGVEVFPGQKRAEIQDACRKAGLIE